MRRPKLLQPVAALIVLLLIAVAVPASADQVVADSDKTLPVSANALNLGTVCVNSSASSKVLLAVQRSGVGGGVIFADGATVTLSVLSTSTSALSASVGTPNSVVLASNWSSLPVSTTMSDPVESTVTLTTGSGTGPGSGTVQYNATGIRQIGVSGSRSGELAVTWTTSNTGTCAPAPLDTTPPVVTVSFASPIVGQNGWFNADDNSPVAGTVTASDDSGVSFISCTDGIGGLTEGPLVGGGSKTASRSLSVSTDGIHSIACTASDTKGNQGAASGSASTATLKIDTADPTLTPSAKTADQVPYTSGSWTNQTVTVSFVCTDTGSGVVGNPSTSQSFPTQTINGSATQGCSDTAGNSVSADFGGINIDKTLPVLIGQVTTPPSGTDANLVDWYNTDVNVKWNASDLPSGVDIPTLPSDSTVIGEGSNRGAGPVYVKDLAGNSGSGSIGGIHIDRQGPAITPATFKVDNTPYTPGTWTNQAVRVEYTCADLKLADNTNGSGVASCPSEEVVNTDGANQSVLGGEARDIAANATPGITTSGIFVDGQAPQTGSQISCTGKNAWCRGQTADVILTAADQPGLSGVKEIRYSVNGGPLLTAPGASKLVTVQLANDKSGTGAVRYFAVDNAGNAETETGVTLKYDNLAPTVTHVVLPTPNASDWNRADVNVHFDATDDVGGSGVDPATVTPDVPVTAETAGLPVNGEAKDIAGNTGYDSVTVKLDKTKPTAIATVVPGPNTSKNGAGWYNGPVTVTFTCADPKGANGAVGSGLATCPDPVTLSSDGADQGASGTAEDLAGNTSDLAEVTGINIDSTPPVVAILGLTQANYVLGNAPSLSCSAVDSTSGLAAPCIGTLTGGNGGGVGTFTYKATATDVAGNTGSREVSYTVGYRWEGFLQPINDTAHQVGVATSIFKAASTVPVKLRVKKADGTVVQSSTLPLWLTPAKGSATSAPVDESAYVDPATTGTTYRWDATGQQYIYNWGTAKNQAGFYWRIGVKLDDGAVHYVNIGLR